MVRSERTDQVRQIASEVALCRARLVGVDGGTGAGKSTIASLLAVQLRCTCIHLDSYLLKGRGSFLPSLDLDGLRSAIDAEKGVVVVEGLCLLEVLGRLSMVPDYLVFVESGSQSRDVKKSTLLHDEVRHYLALHSPGTKANAAICLESQIMNSSYDVDIAYIKSKTIVSVTLAIGGLLQTISGALLLNSGLNEQGAATLRMMGAEISATGLGGIVLCTSVMWAYFAYLARPKFSSRSESRNTRNADGSSEVYEFRSSTQIAVDPEAQPQADARTPGSGLR